MKVSAPHRGWTSGRATPSLRPNPYAAETANPAGRHLSFAEICPDDRGRLCTGEGGGTEDNDPLRASLTLVKRAGEAASIREHPKRTSTMNHIVIALWPCRLYSSIRRWQGPEL